MLDEYTLREALREGQREFLRHALALLSRLPLLVVEGILGARSAKGVTALAWKAKLSMRFAHELQLRMGGLAPYEAIKPRGGADYPMSAEEMDWQLEFFGTLAPGDQTP